MKRLLLIALVGCTVQQTADEDPTAKCDGVLQKDEGQVIDSTFDADGDGFKDADNIECHDVYDPAQLDCDDANPDIRPDAAEVQCNDIDDDCNEVTEDAFDIDGDAIDSCFDCDDNDDRVYPGNEEICWDLVDNDCDNIIDNDCGFDYNGVFAITSPVPHPQYTCFIGAIEIDFDEFTVIFQPPALTILPSNGIQPGTLNGEFDAPGEFVLETENLFTSAIGCDEYYRFSGTFSDADNFTGTLEVVFSGGVCLNCENQLWDVTGVRTQ